MKWIPIDEVPDEWKDGRMLLGWIDEYNGWLRVCWWLESWREYPSVGVVVMRKPTHLMEIVGPEVKV